MPVYDYDAAVTVNAAARTAFETALTNEAAVEAAPVWVDALTKLANPALTANNRYVCMVRFVYEYAADNNKTALRDAAKTLLDSVVGVP